MGYGFAQYVLVLLYHNRSFTIEPIMIKRRRKESLKPLNHLPMQLLAPVHLLVQVLSRIMEVHQLPMGVSAFVGEDLLGI
jgi:hypothetical protein